MRGRGSGPADEFIREVDEAVRQDRWLKLWKQYGIYVAGVALAVIDSPLPMALNSCSALTPLRRPVSLAPWRVQTARCASAAALRSSS